MQRIIYLDNDLGYKIADVKNHQNLLNKQSKLTNLGYHIVCIIDLDSQTISQKGESFSAHSNFINQCYPNIAFEQPAAMPVNELIIGY
jgi:hypothetical protein